MKVLTNDSEFASSPRYPMRRTMLARSSEHSKLGRLLLNAVGFKAVWIASITGAANEMPWLGPAFVIVLIAAHLWLSPHPKSELVLIGLVGMMGFVADSTLLALDYLSYTSGVVAGLAPVWIVTLWMAFATTLNVAFAWLHSRWLLAATLGAVTGPLSYLAGVKFGAVEFTNNLTALAALSLVWAALLPAALWLAEHLHRHGSDSVQHAAHPISQQLTTDTEH